MVILSLTAVNRSETVVPMDGKLVRQISFFEYIVGLKSSHMTELSLGQAILVGVITSTIAAAATSYGTHYFYKVQREHDLKYLYRRWRLERRWEAYHNAIGVLNELASNMNAPGGKMVHYIISEKALYKVYMERMASLLMHRQMFEKPTSDKIMALNKKLVEIGNRYMFKSDDEYRIGVVESYDDIKKLRDAADYSVVMDINKLYELDKD